MGITNSLHQKFATDLLYALQHHQSLNGTQIFFMLSMLLVPGTVSWKLAFFNFFYVNHIGLGKIELISGIVVAVIFIAIALVKLLPKLFLYSYYKKQPYTFLSVKPPYDATQSTFSTTQLITTLHSLGRQVSWWDFFLRRKKIISCELVSTREEGIRYILRVPTRDAAVIQKTLYGYLPGVVVEETKDYLPSDMKAWEGKNTKIIKLKLSTHFLLPLQQHNVLSQHDPIAFLTAQMTKLPQDDLVALQIILTPILEKMHKKQLKELNRMHSLVHHGFDVTRQLNSYHRGIGSGIASILRILFLVVLFYLFWPIFVILFIFSFGKIPLFPTYLFSGGLPKKTGLSKEQQELQELVKQKMGEELFEVTVRFCLVHSEKEELRERLSGFYSSLSVFENFHQGFEVKRAFPLINKLPLLQKIFFLQYKYRLLSFINNPIFSITEISSFYHFPYATTTKTENIVKVHSKQLPAPLSLKNGREMQIIFGNNTYGNTMTPIGLTKEERETHMYIIGRTGSGKTTLMFSMAKNDIENNQGMAFIDPHGDVSEDLLACVPLERENDLIYLNPIDLKHPIGINLLELTLGLEEDEAELEKEVVCEGVISLFRKVFSKEENANAHRIEYILRNTIHTAFTIEGATIFTLYDLLNNPPFQKQVIKHLTDENLKNFWKFEFGRAGDYQVVKMVGGVTAKVGRFLFSPTAKRILEQKKSTINFDQIMNEGKILLCNFSQGNLGEDTARLLGTTILTKIQQAALRRAKLAKNKRKPFYLYVDEFQNFATHSFVKMLSEGRKYGLSVTIAEQSTSQQEEQRLVHTILANVTTVVCFRSANPVDEQLMLAQFSPYVEKGDITNLPRYNFYIKISAFESEEPFSGETIFIPVEKDEKKIQRLIAASRNNWAIVYTRKKQEQKKITVKAEEPTVEEKKEKLEKETKAKKALP